MKSESQRIESESSTNDSLVLDSSQNQTHEVVSFKNVSFGYSREPVLTNINLSLNKKDFVCVLGPNGCGKSTFIKLMLGLLSPDEGKIQLLGQMPAHSCRKVGYLSQSSHLDSQFPVNVEDIVLMGRLGVSKSKWGRYHKEDHDIAQSSLADVQLEQYKSRPFSALSGGQQQRVLIARALACEPEIMVLDEPTANLDPAGQENIYSLLQKLNEKLTIIVVSHDVGFVSTFFRKVVCINDGTLHVHATGDLVQEVITDLYGRQVRMLHTGHHNHDECCH